jgi:hypothetical protein
MVFSCHPIILCGSNGKAWNPESPIIPIRKIVESLFSDEELRCEKNSLHLGRIITHLSDDIECEMSYSLIRTYLVTNRFLHPLICGIQNEVNPRT